MVKPKLKPKLSGGTLRQLQVPMVGRRDEVGGKMHN